MRKLKKQKKTVACTYVSLYNNEKCGSTCENRVCSGGSGTNCTNKTCS
jgi:hypothetical protein